MPNDSTTSSSDGPATRPVRSSRGGIPSVLLAALVAVSLIWMGGVAVVASGGHLPSISLPTSSTPTANSQPAYLYFTITTSATTAYDTFYPANVSVPVNQPVVVTILCYDSGINNVSAPYRDVMGTIGGSATYNFSNGGPPVTLTSLTQGNISHTFTIVYPGAASDLEVASGTPLLSVPVPPSPNGIDATVTTFTMEFTSTGHLVWTCLAPCDPYSMQTPGFMIGSIQVV